MKRFDSEPFCSGSRLRVAIVGAGGIAETHSEVLRRILCVEQVAICDTQVGKARNFALKMNLPVSYGNVESLLSEAKPDVVHLPISPASHASAAIACLEAGSHVFVEKPFCLSTSESERIAAAARQNSRQVGVNHNFIFWPAAQKVIETVKTNRLGQLEHINLGFFVPSPEFFTGPYTHWMYRNGTNLVFELGVHPLSLVYRLFGRLLEVQVMRSNPKLLPSGVKVFGTWHLTMQCERGTASLTLSIAAGFFDMWAHLQGEDASVHIDFRRNTFFLSEKSPDLRPNDDLKQSFLAARTIRSQALAHYKHYILASLRRDAPYPAQFASMSASIRAFYDALGAGKDVPVGPSEGAAVVAFCEMIVERVTSPQYGALNE